MNDLIEGCKVEGTILYENQNINDMNTLELRTKVGMVFQNFNLFPHMTVLDNITLAPTKIKKISKEIKEKEEILARYGMAIEKIKKPENPVKMLV